MNDESKLSRMEFRVSFNGFNKDDVNKFIEELNIRFTESDAEHTRTIQAQKKQIDELSFRLDNANTEIKNSISQNEAEELRKKIQEQDAECERLAVKLRIMQNQVTAAEMINDELNEKMENLNKNISPDLSKKITALENEKVTLEGEKVNIENEKKVLENENSALKNTISDLERTISEFTAKLESTTVSTAADAPAAKGQLAEDDAETDKARTYDKVSHQIGSILIDARKMADDIISEANTRAGHIIAEADERLAQATVYINLSLKRTAADCANEYIHNISNIRKALDTLINETSMQNEVIMSEIERLIKNTAEKISIGIDEIVHKTESKE